MKKGIPIIVLGLSLLMAGVYTRTYMELNGYLEEYLSGAHLIEPGKTLLPLSPFSKLKKPDGTLLSLRLDPFRHAAGYITAQKNIVNLRNYQASSGYFPIRFRPDLSPHMLIKNIEDRTTDIDFLRFHEKTGKNIDYVLIWGVAGEGNNYEETGLIFQQLRDAYELIYTSPQRGLMRLYRLKKDRNLVGA